MPSSQAYICASSGRGVSVISVSTVNHASYSYRSLLDRFGAIILGIREAASPYMMVGEPNTLSILIDICLTGMHGAII